MATNGDRDDRARWCAQPIATPLPTFALFLLRSGDTAATRHEIPSSSIMTDTVPAQKTGTAYFWLNIEVKVTGGFSKGNGTYK